MPVSLAIGVAAGVVVGVILERRQQNKDKAVQASGVAVNASTVVVEEK